VTRQRVQVGNEATGRRAAGTTTVINAGRARGQIRDGGYQRDRIKRRARNLRGRANDGPAGRPFADVVYERFGADRTAAFLIYAILL